MASGTGEQNLFQDLSGVSSNSTDPNPYNALIEASRNDPTQIEARYNLHRTTRAKQQRGILLSPDFQGVNPDPVLRALLDEEARPTNEKTGYVDPRNCLVLWVRPPDRVRWLVGQVQERLRAVVPNMWLMPLPNLHLTALEIVHSITPSALASLEAEFAPLVVPATDIIHNMTRSTRGATGAANLSKPMVTFDASAVALSFLPSPPPLRAPGADADADAYTYHHLRRDIWDVCSSTSQTRDAASGVAGVTVASRYVVPSCHLTVARFVTRADTSVGGDAGAAADPGKVQAFVQAIDDVNAWLEREFWRESEPRQGDALGGSLAERDENPGVWTVGEGGGLDLRKGTVWYGGGETVRRGKGI